MFKVYLFSSKSRTKFQTVILIQLYQKSPFFQKTKEIENSKIISSFENQSFVASNQILLNYIVHGSNSAEPFFKKFYQKSQALFSKNRNSKWTFYSKFIFHQDRLFQHKISVWTTQILRLSNIGQHPGSQAVSETVWTRAC